MTLEFMKPAAMLFMLGTNLYGCGTHQNGSSDLQQHLNISQTTQSVADTRDVYNKMRDVYDSVDGIGQMDADQLFSILAMKPSER